MSKKVAVKKVRKVRVKKTQEFTRLEKNLLQRVALLEELVDVKGELVNLLRQKLEHLENHLLESQELSNAGSK